MRMRRSKVCSAVSSVASSAGPPASGPPKKPSLCAASTIESCASAEVATSSSENVSASIEPEIASRPSSVSPGRAALHDQRGALDAVVVDEDLVEQPGRAGERFVGPINARGARIARADHEVQLAGVDVAEEGA